MKRMLAFLICVSCLLAGCNGGSPLRSTAARTPMPTPPSAPPPTPRPPKRILCIMDGLEEDAPEFFATIQAETKTYDWELETVESPDGFEIDGMGVYDGVLALHFDKRNSIQPLAAAARSGIAVSLIDIYPEHTGEAPSGIASPTAPKGAMEEFPATMSIANYSSAELTAEWVLSAALSYPPHDTPVRMLGLFRAEGSAADAAYQKAVSEGKLFHRGSLYSQNEKEIQAFLEDQLDKWIAGMLDCIFAEDLALAQIALDVLQEAGRDDAEVFAIPNNNMAEQRMLYRRYVFPLAFGPDIASETKLQIKALLALLKGGEGEVREFGVTIENMEPAAYADPLLKSPPAN